MPEKKNQTEPWVETVRDAIRNSGMTHYAISKATDISPGTLDRFMRGDHKDMRLSSVQRLAELLGLELRMTSRSK